jgi:hypothetical protein
MEPGQPGGGINWAFCSPAALLPMDPNDPKKSDDDKAKPVEQSKTPVDQSKKGNGHSEPPEKTALVIEMSMPPETPPDDSQKH